MWLVFSFLFFFLSYSTVRTLLLLCCSLSHSQHPSLGLIAISSNRGESIKRCWILSVHLDCPVEVDCFTCKSLCVGRGCWGQVGFIWLICYYSLLATEFSEWWQHWSWFWCWCCCVLLFFFRVFLFTLKPHWWRPGSQGFIDNAIEFNSILTNTCGLIV